MAVELMIPILVAVFIMGAAFLVMSFVNAGDRRVNERLERFGRGERGGPDLAKQQGGERFSKLLEEAAPKMAEQVMPQTQEQISELKLKLAHAGWRGENAVSKYLLVQFGFFLLGAVLALLLVFPAYGATTDTLIYGSGLVIIFFYIPKIFLWYRTKTRQEAVFLGLPDALDLMVVCVESGLGLDAAMRKVCEEMGKSQPIISEEFSICNFQLQMGRARRDVLHDLGQRTGVDDMKSLAAILIQADRFGASIAQALRVQSDAMRVRRRQLAEERAAKVAVKLLLPLIFFIFPAVFIVLVGPAAIQIYYELVVNGV